MDLDFLYTTRLSVPLFQVVILLGITSIATLFGRLRLALVTTYLFTLYWGYFLNRDLLFGFIKELDYFVFLYFGFGTNLNSKTTIQNLRMILRNWPDELLVDF